MVTHSVYLLGEFHGQEEPGGLQSMGPLESWAQLATNTLY